MGILIPPSIAMVIYAVSTNSSIGKLFIAGVVPGLLLALVLMGVTWGVCAQKAFPRQPKASWAQRWQYLRECFWCIFLMWW